MMSNANNSNSPINASSSRFCFIDIDIDEQRSKLALAAAFVHATDSRYGFSSKDLRKLGGAELARIEDTIVTDHEWSEKAKSNGVAVRPDAGGNRIVFRLFWDTSPLACENFATLCANGSGGKGKVPVGACGKPLTYRGSNIHRIIPGFIMQAGDFVFGNGSGGESIFNNGKKFKDEKAGLELKHDKRGVLSMGNSGKNSNTSQFFITFQPAPQCNSKHVVFGEVVSGFEVLSAVEKAVAEDGNNDSDGTIANKKFTISDCGIYQPFVTPAAGFWYDQPDADSYLGFTPVFMVRPRVVVLGPTKAVCQKFETTLRSTVIMTTISMDDHDDDVDIVAKEVNSLLHQLSIDVVLVAPACSKFSSLKAALSSLPPSWDYLTTKYQISIDQIVIVSKPIEAFSNIKEKSWIGKHDESWKLDGHQ